MEYTSKFVRQKFLDFMESKGHAIIPSASIVPKEDPTVLFNTSGMQPMVPYLLGQPHPSGTRIADSQKCLRTVDIDEVGDNRHLSFFEMLGSWSLGDYFKEETIEWGWEFLTSDEWLGLDPHRLFVTVYRGNGEGIEEDTVAIEAWKKMFAKAGIEANLGYEFDYKNLDNNEPDAKHLCRIMMKCGAENWWGLPYYGPCGPDSEIFYLLNQNEVEGVVDRVNEMEHGDADEFLEDQLVEIWNHVFMEYEGEWGDNDEPTNLKPLAKKNIDTGMGFERLLMALNGFDTVYQTDVLSPIVEVADKWATRA